ncbi:MAG: branched-chain amino acid aminotransferase [Pseudomonadota bacterium]
MAERRIWTWWQGDWHDGNVAVLGAADHGTWLGSVVFDGARVFEDTAPDLDLHCARAHESAVRMGLEPPITAEEMTAIARDGIARTAPGTPLYVRPMLWAQGGGPMMVAPDPETTVFCLCLEERPMPEVKGAALTTTRFRRPTIECAPTDVKAGCLYPNNARMLREARVSGFDNAVSLDALGNVAETATSNIFMVKNGVALTPVANGCFLAGITRNRVLSLLAEDGMEAREATLTLDDLRGADELFTTGNAGKVLPVTRFEDRHLQHGPVTRRARDLYWAYANEDGQAARA